MKCVCPKCSETVDVSEPEVPEKGKFLNCPECEGRFWSHREPFALRGYRKEGTVFCASCGEEPGPDTFCRSCYQLFPEYWVVQKSKPALKKKSHGPKLSLRLPSAPARRKSVEISPVPREGHEAEGEEPKSGKKLLGAVAGFALLLLLVIAGAVYYQNQQTEKQFADNFVLTVYGIKSGTDYGFRALEKMAAGQAPPSSKEISDLNTIKAQIDGFRGKLGTPPERYAATADAVSQFYDTFVRIHRLATSEAAMAADLAGQIDNLEGQAANAESNLKRSVPEDLLAKVQNAVIKYKNLKFMLE